jgi:gluconolactonase
MNYYRKAGLTLLGMMAIATTIQAQSGRLDSISVVAPDAELKQVSNQFTFTEGPAVNKKGDIYFTDQPNDKIWLYDTNGKLSLYMDKTGRSNGLYFDKKGNLISCADAKNELWSISPDKKIKVLLTDFEGKKLNGPNDLWIDPKGNIYFTDPYYQRDYWERKKPDLDGQKVYYLPKGKQQPITVDADLQQPNGIVGTPDGKHLYVADIRAGKTYKYDIAADGSLTNRQLFVSQGSDGMTLDNQGNLYLSGKGITVYSPEGQNLCFGGKARNVLFITATESVYTLPMRVKGVE